MKKNIDLETVDGFGDEWDKFSQEKLSDKELLDHYSAYFNIFDWEKLPKNARGFDMGCGSGRWARISAAKIAELHCIDASEKALNVAKRNLKQQNNCVFHHATFDNIPLEDSSMDFGYSLGVLHHLPDPQLGISACVRKLKPGAPFLAYIYYAFDDKPTWFKFLWRMSDVFRKKISKLSFKKKSIICDIIAITVYFPLARFACLLEKLGINISNFPLSYYRKISFYTMKTDALDRFGTQLEWRFTKVQIQEMFEKAGLERISFSDQKPNWCALGYKKS